MADRAEWDSVPRRPGLSLGIVDSVLRCSACRSRVTKVLINDSELPLGVESPGDGDALDASSRPKGTVARVFEWGRWASVQNRLSAELTSKSIDRFPWNLNKSDL